MAIITRKLKYATWEYDTDKQTVRLVLEDSSIQEIELNKTYTYSLGRFLIRVWQKMAQRHRKNPPAIKQAIATTTTLKKGFTLIELLIAIALLGAVLIGISGLIKSSTKNSPNTTNIDTINYDNCSVNETENELTIECR